MSGSQKHSQPLEREGKQSRRMHRDGALSHILGFSRRVAYCGRTFDDAALSLTPQVGTPRSCKAVMVAILCTTGRRSVLISLPLRRRHWEERRTGTQLIACWLTLRESFSCPLRPVIRVQDAFFKRPVVGVAARYSAVPSAPRRHTDRPIKIRVKYVTMSYKVQTSNSWNDTIHLRFDQCLIYWK